MTYLLLTPILLAFWFLTHTFSHWALRRFSTFAVFPTNALIFVVSYFLAFFVTAEAEYQIYGASGMYDVALLLFLAFGLAGSVVSSVRIAGCGRAQPRE